MSDKKSGKRQRHEFESDDESAVHQQPKRARTTTYDEPDERAMELMRRPISKYIEMNDCFVTFTSIQSLPNTQGITLWEATLKHKVDSKSIILAETTFHVINVSKISNFQGGALVDLVDTEQYFYEVLFVKPIEIRDAFQGNDYGVCLLQRIIDNHARGGDLVIVDYIDSMKDICDKLNFQPTVNPHFRQRIMRNVQPYLEDVALCFQKDSAKQIEFEPFLDQYVGAEDENSDEQKAEAEVKCEDIDLNSCFVTFSVDGEKATNYQISMFNVDYVSCWLAKLQYRPPNGQPVVTLATALFWVIHCDRLSNHGHEERLHDVLHIPCQELADLKTVMNNHVYDDLFKLHPEDKMNFLKRRHEKRINEMMTEFESNDRTVAKEVLYEDLAQRSVDEMNAGHGNVVYLDRVEVDDRYWGRMFGRCLVQKVIDNFCRGPDCVVLKPFPLQWESEQGAPDVDQHPEHREQFEKDKKKVIEVYESMWFCRFGGPDSPYWGRCAMFKHPTMVIEKNVISFEDP